MFSGSRVQTSIGHPPDSRVQAPGPSLQIPEPRFQTPACRGYIPDARVQTPDSGFQSADSRVELPDTSQITFGRLPGSFDCPIYAGPRLGWAGLCCAGLGWVAAGESSWAGPQLGLDGLGLAGLTWTGPGERKFFKSERSFSGGGLGVHSPGVVFFPEGLRKVEKFHTHPQRMNALKFFPAELAGAPPGLPPFPSAWLPAHRRQAPTGAGWTKSGRSGRSDKLPQKGRFCVDDGSGAPVASKIIKSKGFHGLWADKH